MEKQEYINMYRLEVDFWWFRTLHDLVLNVIKSIKGKKTRIFDAGCGTGRMMELLQDHGNVSGIDFSENAISFCKKRGLRDAKLGDLNDWTFDEKEPYDIILSLDVLYHENIDSDHAILQKIYNGLSKNGTLILNLAAFRMLNRDHDKMVHAKRRYLKRPLLKKLQEIGFTIEKATYRMPHVFLIIIFQKMARKVIPSDKTVSDVHAIPKWINAFLTFLGRVENRYVLYIGNIPFGSSLFIIVKKE